MTKNEHNKIRRYSIRPSNLKLRVEIGGDCPKCGKNTLEDLEMVGQFLVVCHNYRCKSFFTIKFERYNKYLSKKFISRYFPKKV